MVAAVKSDPLHHLDIPTPEAGEIVKIADDLLWYKFDLPFRLNHINLFALDTNDGWMLIDCGINSKQMAAQWDAILPQLEAQAPIAGIIVSHHHADHIGYAGALAVRTGAPIYIGEIEHDMARWALAQSAESFSDIAAGTYANFGLADELITRTSSIGNYYRQLVVDFPEARLIAHDHRFTSKSGEWQVRFDAGHAPGHLGLYDSQRQIYIAVDFLLGRISPNISVGLRDPNADVLAHYYTYLGGVDDLSPDWRIICGHDWHYFDGARRARQLIDHHDMRLNQLRDAKAALSTADAMSRLFVMELTDHEVYFASCEARAHLNHLVTLGDMSREIENGVAIFHPT